MTEKEINEMNTNDETPRKGLTRRQFLKAAGFTSAAFMVPNVLANYGLTANAGVTSMTNVNSNRIGTDVLIIGGGMSGTFAALTAKAKGLNVTLVDKGTVGRSGSTPWANTFSYFDPETADRDTWISGVRASSEYVNNLDWLDQMLDNSQSAWNELVSWGVFESNVRHPSLVFRDVLVENNIELIERTMITTLLTEDGKPNSPVIGAMGFSIDTEEAVVILAKATIMCAGAGSFKASGFPIQSLTSDGDAMAYRAGAVISGKEFVDFHSTSAENPASCWNQWSGMWDSGIGQTNSVFTAGMTLDGAYTAHQGLASVTEGASVSMESGAMPEGEMPEGGPDSNGEDRPEGPPPGEGEGGPPGNSRGIQVLGAATGLGIHKAEGIWPTSIQGACNVPGLFAAGDGLASMVCGSSYVGLGFSLTASATQGVAAAEGAAEYAVQAATPTISDALLTTMQEALFAPRERETGFTPAWVTQVLQNTMFPYYVLMVKKQDRLEAALTTITFLREHMVPYLIAVDAHDLRLAHETSNMLINAEMKLRASLARTESRGTHYREDYPARDDDNWLAWVLLQMDANGDMTVFKENIPDEWKPDLSVSYLERYTNRFPGELAYLGLE